MLPSIMVLHIVFEFATELFFLILFMIWNRFITNFGFTILKLNVRWNEIHKTFGQNCSIIPLTKRMPIILFKHVLPWIHFPVVISLAFEPSDCYSNIHIAWNIKIWRECLLFKYSESLLSPCLYKSSPPQIHTFTVFTIRMWERQRAFWIKRYYNKRRPYIQLRDTL